MSHATTDPLMPASSPVNGSSPPLPSFEDLSRWTLDPDHRVVIRGVDWAFYERLVESIPEGANIHVDFDGEDVEIMSPGALHDGDKKLFGQLVEAVTQELEVPYKSGGRRPGNGPRSLAAWSRMNATFSGPRSWRRWPAREQGVRQRSPTFQTPTLPSKSTSHLLRLTALASTRP